MTKNRKPDDVPYGQLLGVVLAIVASSLVIHFCLADLFATWMDESRDTAEAALFLFQGLFTAWCAWRIASRKDGKANESNKSYEK